MATWLRLAAVLIASTVANCASVEKTPVSQGQDPITLAEAIAAYNRAPEVTHIFRLYGGEPQATLDTPTGPGLLLFSIKETVCPKQAVIQSSDNCHFKEKGVVKDCTATTYEKLGNKSLVVTCETVATNAPVRRPRQVRQCTTVNNRQKCKIVRPSVNSALNVPNNNNNEI